MYWNLLTILLTVAGLCLIFYGMGNLPGDGYFGATLLVVGSACLLMAFIISEAHQRDDKDRAVESVLRSQGFLVVDVDTASHLATLSIGDACTRELRLEKRNGRWQLLVELPNGERRVFPRSMIDNGGKACSSGIR